MNRYNIVVIFILTAFSTAVSYLLLWLNDKTTITNLYFITFTISTLFSLIIYDIIIKKRLKKSFGKFLSQVKQGNFESSEANIIQKYDFVTLTDIQVELSQMVGQIKADQNEQKRYIENVSHELMTPIAIIRGKLELLIQSPNIAQSDFKLISDILNKLDRLTKVNQSLVLLSKIDYNHYQSIQNVKFSDVINETLNLLEDQIRVNKLIIRKINNDGELISNMNEALAYLLIKNIIKNAVIHNVENGYINIKQTTHKLTITNSGKNISVSPSSLFERFKVIEESNDSIGLGLSIIRKICDVSDIQLLYVHNNGEHTIELTFK